MLIEPMHLSMSLLTTRNSSQKVNLEESFCLTLDPDKSRLSASFIFCCCWPRNVKKDLSKFKDRLKDEEDADVASIPLRKRREKPATKNYTSEIKAVFSTPQTSVPTCKIVFRIM